MCTFEGCSQCLILESEIGKCLLVNQTAWGWRDACICVKRCTYIYIKKMNYFWRVDDALLLFLENIKNGFVLQAEGSKL